MRLALLLTVAAAALAGCAAPEPRRVVETIRVEVPVPVHRDPPAELAEPYHPETLPVFVAPTDAHAVVGLTADGVRALQLLLHGLKSRDAAWRAWATEEGEDEDD